MKFRKLILSFYILISITAFSCTEKDEFLTSGEQTALTISNVISENKIIRVSPYEWKFDELKKEYGWVSINRTFVQISDPNLPGLVSYYNYESTDFTVEKSFIKIEKKYYNLEHLYKYEIKGLTLELYFGSK